MRHGAAVNHHAPGWSCEGRREGRNLIGGRRDADLRSVVPAVTLHLFVRAVDGDLPRRLLDLRRTIASYGCTEFELGQLANLAPEAVEEAKLLIPTLDVSA